MLNYLTVIECFLQLSDWQGQHSWLWHNHKGAPEFFKVKFQERRKGKGKGKEGRREGGEVGEEKTRRKNRSTETQPQAPWPSPWQQAAWGHRAPRQLPAAPFLSHGSTQEGVSLPSSASAPGFSTKHSTTVSGIKWVFIRIAVMKNSLSFFFFSKNVDAFFKSDAAVIAPLSAVRRYVACVSRVCTVLSRSCWLRSPQFWFRLWERSEPFQWQTGFSKHSDYTPRRSLSWSEW